jgi:acyl transferase domain-containing protein/acyl carrier protein
MDSFLERIARLPHKKLALLATELYERSRAGATQPIAITAMACRFPGNSDTPEAFWSFLERGGDAIELVPEERLAMIGRSPADVASGGPIWGGFLRQVDGFDPAVFGISAKEAESMDPQQRLLLEVCWEALENAGTPIDALDRETGVFIGVSGIDFAMLGLEADLEPNGYMLTGAAHAVIAGRLSYVFGLNGPSTVLDTACAAAASAIHLACQSLRAGECEQAIAGGINLTLIPEMAQMLATMQVMARDGRCKVFSADADGFVRAEGCGVITLRRVSDAIVRGEPILGVIRGTAWNQDGRSGGLTAPNGAAQERVIKAALADAALSPDQVSYVEAHGTGTALGDPIELSALGRVFDTGTREKPLVVGSVKANIGHLEAAAGIASVIKVLLALRHEKIPPHLHAATLNPRIDWATLPLHVPTGEMAWPNGPEPRVAGVSAFGISGTNVHMVISEPPPEAEPDPVTSCSRTLLTLSAKSREALVALAGRYADLLVQRRDVEIVAFAAAANLKRAHFAHRLTLIAADAAQVERTLRRFGQGDAASGAQFAFVAGHRAPQIGMLFGDALPNADLLARLSQEPAFRSAYDAWLSALSDRKLGAISAAVGFQVALTALWRAWGVQPAIAAGAGWGEIAAAVTAGGLSLSDAAALTCSIDSATEPPSVKTEQLKIPLILERGRLEAGVKLPPSSVSMLGKTPAGGSVRQQAQTMVDRLITLQPADEQGLLDELAAVYLAGATVDWTAVHANQRPAPVLLPNYPFQRRPFWPVEFSKTFGRQRDAVKGPSRDPNAGLYRVEWQSTERRLTLDDDAVAKESRPRFVALLCREEAAAAAARSALEAAGLVVQDISIATGRLSRTQLETLAAGSSDTAWLYVLPNGSSAEDPAGEARVALEDVLVIAQVMLEIGAAAPALYVVTMGTQSISSTVRPADATVWGLGRVLAAEAPGVRVSFVDLDAAKPDWDGLVNIVARGCEDAELALAEGRALAPTLVPIELPARPKDPLASAEASYIVTGAFGFIGELTTRWLVQQGAGKLFLVGHNPPRVHALAAIEAARTSGTEVETIIVDISTEAGVETLFARVQADARPLKGIIHSAAALDDASISRQTPDTLSRALGAKAAGAWLLHEQSLGYTLDFFVLYSSAAALIGTPGQANYAAANCYLDALAHYRRTLGLTGLSLNWGLWESTGLAVKRDVVGGAATQGAVPITAENGMAILGRAIDSGEIQVAVLPLDWALVRQTLGTRRPPTLLRALLSTFGEAPTTGDGLLASYVALFQAASGAERSSLLVEFTRRRSGELLHLDPATPISDDQPLLDLGLDSLVGLELRNNLQTVAGVTFPSTLFFDCPTVSDLAHYFRMVLPAEDKAGAKASEQAYERISV